MEITEWNKIINKSIFCSVNFMKVQILYSLDYIANNYKLIIYKNNN